MSQIEIRQITLSQASLLAAIHAASFGNSAWGLEQIQGSLALETTKGWVALKGEKVLGFILCQVLPEQTEVLTFAVHPESQRRGIGERLLQKVIETMCSKKGGRIILEVEANNDAARHLYEKHGFRKSGIRPGYYKRDTSAIDAILYERILSEQ